MTHLCVPIFVTDIERAKRDVSAALEAGADLIELRVDTAESAEQVKSVIAAFDVRFVVTCRAEYEGGHSTLGDADRIAFIRDARSADDYADIELQALRAAGDVGIPPKQIIASSHDFTGRPAKLYNLVDELKRIPGLADVTELDLGLGKHGAESLAGRRQEDRLDGPQRARQS